ncbi:hemolysin family protein [Paenibacillus cisolokensis]|uniref:hemolysin family protein n=1 Tax=Paenibacillus cisolokensis TaxID=1658519 RepID=UPI000781639F|nr:hemolysin family protein [Paenibacillus sp. 32O-W]
MTNLAIILALVFMNGFFVAAELAMGKIRGSRIGSLTSEGKMKARFATHLTNNLDAYLLACQLGITLASLGLGLFGAPAISSMLSPWLERLQLSGEAVAAIALVIAFALVALLHIIIGNVAPKTLASRKPESVALLAAVPVMAFRCIVYPFVWLLHLCAGRIVKLLGFDSASRAGSAHTEEEIRTMMKESHKSGLIDNTELTLVDNIFEFTETSAREIMIPRTDIICLDANLPYAENRLTALREMRTRYPVCEGDKDNMIGFVHIKDLLQEGAESITDIRQIIRPITTVPESMQISTLLKLMQKKKTQIAILIDEYGGTSGLVTLEDIMEEIVGEIQDEFDEERPDIERKDEHTYSISGLMLIEEVNSFFGLDIDTDDYDTIGGWIYSQIEIPPRKDQKISIDGGFEFTIEETDHLRISRIMVRRLTERQEEDGVAQTGLG